MAEKKTNEKFISEMATVQPTVEVIGKYNGARVPVTVRCRLCGYTWDSLPTNLLKGRKCPKCSYVIRGAKHRTPQSVFIEKVSSVNPDVEILDDYQNTNTKVTARCKRCFFEWEVLPSSLLRGSGCPRCSHTGTSFVEQLILLSLQYATGEVVLSRDRSTIGLELDIYLPQKQFAVEYGAWLWHKDKASRDKEKTELCEKNGIRLIQIYDAYDGENKSDSNLWLYKENLGYLANINIVKSIIARLCDELNTAFDISDDTFKSLQVQAKENSRRMLTADLNTRLAERDAKVLVISDYQDMLTKVTAKCLVCGNMWDVIPASLLRGLGCPKCAKERSAMALRKPVDAFVAELAKINPDVEVLGRYVNRHTPIDVKCNKHNYYWSTTPGSLLRGSGCPLCRNERISLAQSKSHEQFITDLSSVNSEIIVLGQYSNNREKIEVQCKKCAHVWKASPSSLLAGEGCPVCGRRSQAEKRKKTPEQFRAELKIKNCSIELLDDYKDSHSKVHVRCKKCLYEWDALPTSLLHGYGCPTCAGNKRKTQEEFISQMAEIHPNIEVCSQYKNAKTNVSLRCIKCGCEWEDTPSNLLSGRGCRHCKKQHNYT